MAAVDENRALARARDLAQDDQLVLAFDLLLREQGAQSLIAFIE